MAVSTMSKWGPFRSLFGSEGIPSSKGKTSAVVHASVLTPLELRVGAPLSKMYATRPSESISQGMQEFKKCVTAIQSALQNQASLTAPPPAEPMEKTVDTNRFSSTL